MESDYKLGGTGMVTFGTVSGRIKKSDFNLIG